MPVMMNSQSLSTPTYSFTFFQDPVLLHGYYSKPTSFGVDGAFIATVIVTVTITVTPTGAR